MTASNHRREPGPAQLPGIEGFYVLRAGRELGRYDGNGRFRSVPELTKALEGAIGSLMRHYRAGDVDGLAMGLVTTGAKDRPWRCASLVFSEPVLREVFRTGDDDKASLTTFEHRNRTRSLFQGMEIVLSARDPVRPEYPRYCPVLYAPDVDAEVLRRRYGIQDVDAARVFEVLDLMAPLPPEQRWDRVFSRMAAEVLNTRIAPEMRSSPELMVAAGAGPEIEAHRTAADQRPWLDEDEDENRSVEFKPGEPVPYWLLGRFTPFNQLNDLQRQFIARGLTISRRPAGTVFVEQGSQDDASVCLVEGTIRLEAFDGRTISIVGGTKRAQIPISQLRPHAYTVRAETDVTVFLLSQSMVRKVTRIVTTYSNRPGIEVQEVGLLPDSVEGYA
ncbi:MAG: cyclic nucleotide-binding domain-containing protein [Arenicellales bacterium]